MKKNTLLFFMLLLSLMTARAQDKEFWFATPIQIYGASNTYGGHGGFVFTNPTNRQAIVNIEYYKDRSSDTTIFIPAFSYNHCYYPTKARMTSLVEEITNVNFGNPNFSGAVHISSNVNVMVYYITDYYALQETFLLKGKAAHGTAFSIVGAKGGAITSINSSQFLGNAREPYISVAATENNTSVNIQLSGNCINYAAGNHTVILNKGNVLILRGATASVNLNGSYITSNKPISITAGTDGRGTLVGAADDQCADQLVSDVYAGNVYVMPLTSGFKGNDALTQKVMNFMEIKALEPNTSVEIDWGSGLTPLTTLANAGDVFYSDSFSVYRQNSCPTIISDKPIHIMQVTGHEASICHVPNFYATNTHQTSFFSYWEPFTGKNIDPGLTLVYSDAGKEGITIQYSGQSETPLFDWITNNGIVVNGQGNVPQFPGWKYIRITLPNTSNPLATPTSAPDATNKIVTVKSKSSVFQLAMSSSFYYGTNLTYLTAFNSEFSFDPDTVWTCPGIYTNLIGGIASNYKWTLPDGSIQQGASLNSIKAKQMGMYILEMTQGFNNVIDTCWVESISFSKNSSIGKSLTKPFKVGKLQQFVPSIDQAAAKHMTEFKWTFGGGATPATSTDPSPTVVWNTTGVKEVTLYMKYETVYPDSTRAVCDSFLTVRVPVNPLSVEYFVDPSTLDKVGVDDAKKSDDELYFEGKSWKEPFNLEDALTQASQGDLIYVPQGTYTPKQGGSFVIDCDSVTIIGGFAGWEKDTTELVPAAEKTILQGKGDSSTVVFELDPLSGACGITSATRLDGFTIQGGNAVNGGGVWFKNGASGTLANCIIRNNRARENGGGIYTAPYGGCGTSPDPVLYNVEISGNAAKNGAGIYNDGSQPTLTNVTISGNRSSASGAGMYNAAASPTILNTIIYGNVTGTTPLSSEFVNAGGAPYISYSIISGSYDSNNVWISSFGTDGSNNADKDPLFKKRGYMDNGTLQKGNYRLSFHSRAFDRGRDSYAIFIGRDLDGYNRIAYDRVDMGAYEYHTEGGGTHAHQVVIANYPNLITEPMAGLHSVTGHDSFVLVIKPAAGYSLDHIQITTGSKAQDQEGGMTKEKLADGSIKVIFQKVTDPLNIEIKGVSPTSNEGVNGSTIWSEGNKLQVRTNEPGILTIYTMNGQLHKQQEVDAGQTTIVLSKGVYIVTLDNKNKQKVVIK